MSLLPQQIIPQNQPLGKVINGEVIINENWWLLIYNLCLNSLPNATPGGVSPAQSVDVTASPFSYTAGSTGFVLVTGGELSNLTLTRKTAAIQVGVGMEGFFVARGDMIEMTYSKIPTVTFFPLVSG